MIKLTPDQVTLLKTENFESVLLYNELLDVQALFLLGEQTFDRVYILLGLTGTYKSFLEKGSFADLNAFNAYLTCSRVLKLALAAAKTSPTIRKLIFELLFWSQSQICYPDVLVATWQELITVTRGSIKANLTSQEIVEWNANVTATRMNAAFML